VHGLNLENWQAELAEAKEPFNLGRLIRLVKEYHLLNPVIVDCTSHQAVADQYADFLREGFHVVTPNKKANTSSMDYYHQLRHAAAKSRRKFLYDTNVGAGCRLSKTCKTCSMRVMSYNVSPAFFPARCRLFSVSLMKG
jgi:aspartokinase/homoserine dehydrogenase 1